MNGYVKYSLWQLYTPTHYTGYLSYTSQNGSSKNFQKGSQKHKEMNNKKTINIPLSASDWQIVKRGQTWTLKYSLSEDRSAEIVINQPCEIDRIYTDRDRLCVVLKTYTKQEFVNL